MSDIETAPALGHNKPPLVDDEALRREFGDLLAQVDAIAARANALPKEIESDEQDGEASKVIADATKTKKAIEAIRVDRKAPFLQAGLAVDGVFVAPRDRVERVSAGINVRLTAYKRRKEAEARAERDRIAREAREEAERQAAEARRLADAAAAAEAAGRHAEADRALNDAVAAETTTRAAEIDAHLSQRQAEAKPAELARTRSGSTLSTLQAFWDFEVLDRGKIDLEALRPFIADEAIDKAIRAAVRAGRRDLAGVRIFENHRASVRG